MSQNFTALLLNLDRDTARLAHMENQLAQAGIAYTRLPGILGDDLPGDLRGFFFDAAGIAKTTMKRGEIGCYASHLRALQRIAAGDYGTAVLVMEDDLEFISGVKDVIAQAMRALPQGWDILRLSSPPRRAYMPVAHLPGGSSVIRYSKIPMGAGAYLVTPAGARKFLQHGMRGLTFDDDLRRPWFHKMETYGLLPHPAHANRLQSTIDRVEGGRFDKGISSRMERLLRGDHLYALRRVAYNIGNLGFMSWLTCMWINLIDMAVKPFLKRSVIHDAARLIAGKRAHAG